MMLRTDVRGMEAIMAANNELRLAISLMRVISTALIRVLRMSCSKG